MKGNRILSLAAASLLAALSAAQWTGIPFISGPIQGDFSAAGSPTREAVVGAGPVSVGVSTPGGSTHARTFAVWNWLGGSAGYDTNEASITINSTPVTATGFAFGKDLCWGQAEGHSYLADVSGIVTADGVYSVGGVTDKLNASGVTSLGEGVSFVTVYFNSASPVNMVALYFGNIGENTASATVDSSFLLPTPYLGGPAHLFLNAMDGQPAGDTWSINGFDGSGITGGAPGDAWMGMLGGGPNTLYDHADGDVSGFMTLGDTGITLQTVTTSDCIGHSFGAISYSAVPEPASFAVLGLGLAPLLRRRKK